MGVINYTGNSSAFVKSIGVPGLPVAFESYYYDDATKKSRPYQSTAEVLAYLNTSQSRMGHKTLYVRVGSVLVGGELSGGELREFWFKDGVTNADLVEKSAVLPKVPDRVTIKGPEWNVSKYPRIVINLVDPITTINTEAFPANLLGDAIVKQPATGGKRLIIDSKEVGLNVVGGKLVGDTRLICENINGVTYISADPNAIATKPVLETQTADATVLAGSHTLLWAKFLDLGRSLLYRVEKNGKPQSDHTGASLLLEGLAENVGSWEIIAIDAITKLETRSAPIVFTLGDPEPVFVISGPSDQTINAGEPFTISAQFGGTPPPEVKCIEVTGQDGDLPTGPVVANGTTYSGVALYTKDFAFIGSNTIVEMVEVTPAEYDADGFITKPAVYENRKTVYKKATSTAKITPDKQEQAAPTNPITNDNEDLYDWTNAPGISDLSKYEQTLDGAVTKTPLSGKPLQVSDTDIASGKVGVRVAETLTHKASEWLFNGSPFTPLIKGFTFFTPSDKFTRSGNTIVVQPAWGVGSAKKLPLVDGAYVEGTIMFNLKVSPPLLVLDDTAEAENTEANQKYAIGAIAPGSGYNPTTKEAVFTKIIEGVSTGSSVFDFSEGDKVRFQVRKDGATWKLDMKHYHLGQEFINETVNYPVPLFIKALGGYGDTGGTLAVVYSGFNLT